MIVTTTKTIEMSQDDIDEAIKLILRGRDLLVFDDEVKSIRYKIVPPDMDPDCSCLDGATIEIEVSND